MSNMSAKYRPGVVVAIGLTAATMMAASVLAGSLFTVGSARAQIAAPNGPASNNPPQVQTEGQAPSPNLSDTLERNKGVIRPKDGVDPEIHATPPDSAAGTMPVIPPPGSPGGDQRIQPK